MSMTFFKSIWKKRGAAAGWLRKHQLSCAASFAQRSVFVLHIFLVKITIFDYSIRQEEEAEQEKGGMFCTRIRV